MVHLSGQYPSDGHGRSAFAAACAKAARVARDVLVFGSTPDDANYLALGFRPVLDRVMLALVEPPA
jgi:hypothetical protein